MKNLLSLIVTLIFLSGTGLMAQKATEFASKTANADKISIKFDFPAEGKTSKNGSGYSANVNLLDPKPKKIALVSFYLYDPACGKSTKTTTTTAIHSSASIWTTPQDVAQTHVDGFYTQSIEALKSGFKKFGVELLTPAEFLDTKEKEEFFYGFNQESGKKEKTERTQIGAYVQVKGGTLKICPNDGGYRPFFVANEPLNTSMLTNFVNMGIGGANRKMTSSLGCDLAKELGVDAVAVCYIVTRKPSSKKDDYVVDAVSLYVLGPNPVDDSHENKNRGQFYCGTRYFAKQLEFANAKAGTTSYDNMGNVMMALAKKNANWIINRAKK